MEKTLYNITSSDFFQLQLPIDNSLHDSWSKFHRRKLHSPKKNIEFLSHGLSILKTFFWGINQRNGGKTPVQITCDNIIHAPPSLTTPWLPDMFFADKASGEIQHMFPALFQTKCTKLDHPSQISRKKCYARFVCLDFFFILLFGGITRPSARCILPLPVPQPKSKHRPIAWCFHVGKNGPTHQWEETLNFELLCICC